MAPQDSGLRFSETASGTTSATATHSAVTNKVHYITGITVSSDTNGSAAIKTGSTTIWQFQVSSSSIPCSISFLTPLAGSPSAAVSVTLTGTSVCFANIAGFEL